MLKSPKEKMYAALIALFAFASVGVAVFGLVISRAEAAGVPAAGEPAPVVSLREPTRVIEIEKFVEVEKEFSTETVQSGLRDMGVLLTGEYYFTEVVSFSSVKTFPLLSATIELPLTESGYLASYDGVVTAGVNFGNITVEKDEDLRQLTIRLPKAAIANVDIDPTSLVLYSEKSGLGNPISYQDFNTSQIQLEESARQRALDTGLLDSADKNARILVSNFVHTLIPAGYTVTVVNA